MARLYYCVADQPASNYRFEPNKRGWHPGDDGQARAESYESYA